MSIELKAAIQNAQTFAELLPIARQLDAKYSFFGSEYVVINPKNGEPALPYTGKVHIGDLVLRTQQIIKTHYTRKTYPERIEAALLDTEIERFYFDAEKNYKNRYLITKISLFAINFILGFISCLLWFPCLKIYKNGLDSMMDYKDFWYGAVEFRCLDRHILSTNNDWDGRKMLNGRPYIPFKP